MRADEWPYTDVCRVHGSVELQPCRRQRRCRLLRGCRLPRIPALVQEAAIQPLSHVGQTFRMGRQQQRCRGQCPETLHHCRQLQEEHEWLHCPGVRRQCMEHKWASCQRPAARHPRPTEQEAQ